MWLYFPVPNQRLSTLYEMWMTSLTLFVLLMFSLDNEEQLRKSFDEFCFCGEMPDGL